MFSGVELATSSWSALLIDVEANNVNNGVTWSGGNSTHTNDGAVAKAALQARVAPWVISDLGLTTDLIFTVKTDNAGTSNNDQLTLPLVTNGQDVDIDWGVGTISSINTQAPDHTTRGSVGAQLGPPSKTGGIL